MGSRGRKKYAYFVMHGKAGFVGAIGGPQEQTKGGLYSLITTKLGGEPGFTADGMQSEADVQAIWKALLVGKEFSTIPEVWRNHQQCWTITEVAETLAKIAGEVEAMEVERENGERAGHEGGSVEEGHSVSDMAGDGRNREVRR